ncbi:MAG TPA: DNA-3-methyladenine glycosylase I [Catalimonadaceae bacterium]|nr:DNA-3-methyladenine glycosylase I [Catalimonadaceae bacterium]
MEKTRCSWCLNSELERNYHDSEWGVPLWDDQKLFEFIIIDGFQAGLSWKIILNKRENFRKAFYDFNPEILASVGQNQIEIWMQDAGIIRNRLKLEALPRNAKAYLETKSSFSSFAEYIWSFVGGKPIVNEIGPGKSVPSVSPEAIAMSKDMKKRGFVFCGPTICYAFMQAAGLVNDHHQDCFRYKEILGK